MREGTVIRTERLLLRPFLGTDAAAVLAYASDPLVTRYLAWPTHRSLEDSRAFLTFAAQEWSRAPAGPFAILWAGTGQLVGSTGLVFDDPQTAAVGYVLAREWWGRAIASEALRAMVRLAADLGVRRLYGIFHVDHHGSERVLAQCGFTADPEPPERERFPNLGTETLQTVRRYVIDPVIAAYG